MSVFTTKRKHGTQLSYINLLFLHIVIFIVAELDDKIHCVIETQSKLYTDKVNTV